MPIIGWAIALAISIFAGHDIAKKSVVAVVDGGQVVKFVKVKSPATILILRDGDGIRIRTARRGEWKKLKRGATPQ